MGIVIYLICNDQDDLDSDLTDLSTINMIWTVTYLICDDLDDLDRDLTDLSTIKMIWIVI